MVAVGQGEVWWADLADPTGSGPGFRRPIVVVTGRCPQPQPIGDGHPDGDVDRHVDGDDDRHADSHADGDAINDTDGNTDSNPVNYADHHSDSHPDDNAQRDEHRHTSAKRRRLLGWRRLRIRQLCRRRVLRGCVLPAGKFL
ncbi:MAG: hypothetical protein ACRERC_09505 [Candidatus Binatia bacterium]